METEEQFLIRIRGAVFSIDLAYLDALSAEDFRRLLNIKSKHWNKFELSDDDVKNMELLKMFCTPNWPDMAKKANNPEWQSVVDFLLLEAFKRRVGATNEDSAAR